MSRRPSSPAPARVAASGATISRQALNRALLARQMLLARERTTALAAVERLAGLQAQVARPPFVGLWTRLQDFRREELLELLRERVVVRVTAMRATLHILSAADYLRFRGALQPALTRGVQSVLRTVLDRLDVEELERLARAFFATPATFDALRKRLVERGDGLERAMAYAIRIHVPLVQVPTDDVWGFPASADFALADTWLNTTVSTRTAPAQELVRRYLAAFGPATPTDAQAWSGLSGLREVFEALRPELVTFRDERKRELFDLPDAPRPDPESPAPVRFMPDYDNLVLAHDDRSRIVGTEHRGRLVSKNLQVSATLLVDGFVAGTWKVARKGRTVSLAIRPFERFPKKLCAEIEREGDSLLAFLEPDIASRTISFVE